MATFMLPPRTPSPKVRIRSQSFDSPSSRISVTPIEESPCSKSTGHIICKPLPRHDVLRDMSQHTQVSPIAILTPLHTKMSDESILSTSSASSTSSSPTTSEQDYEMDLAPDSPLLAPHTQRARPHPLAFVQSASYDANDEPGSPFMYQDRSFPMHSPWLVRAVLDMYDVRGLDWMSIAEPIQRIWGVQTSSAEVLDILSDNGRVGGRMWWD